MPTTFLPSMSHHEWHFTDEPDELAVINFVGLSLLCSPLSDEADFETTLALSLVVAGRSEDGMSAPTLPCSKCQHPSCTRCIMPCACHPWPLIATLYTNSDFQSHKFLKTHLPVVLNLSLVKQHANNHTNPNKEALKAHGFSQKERIVQNISLALNIPDIQPIRAMNITKNRTNVHGRLIDVGVVLIVFICSFTCCYVSASSIYFHIRHSRI